MKQIKSLFYEAGAGRIARILFLSLKFAFHDIGSRYCVGEGKTIQEEISAVKKVCSEMEQAFFLNIVDRQKEGKFLYCVGGHEELSVYFAGVAPYIDYLLVAKDSGIKMPGNCISAEVIYRGISYYVVFCLKTDRNGYGEVTRLIDMQEEFLAQLVL